MKIYTTNGGELNPAIVIDKQPITILLDNGHAKSTPGKRSPVLDDGKQFFEYEFTRDIVKRIAVNLNTSGIPYKIIVPEISYDVPLIERANRVNKYCLTLGTDKCFLISVHANASGDGTTWMSAKGWSVYTTKGDTKSDKYADIFWNEANLILPAYNITLRQDLCDGDKDFEEDFTILKKTKCPAILTENLFQDNKTDCKFLMSDTGRNAIAQLHINAIKRIINLN